MGDAPGLGWWQASDGQWYPPELHPTRRPRTLAPPEQAHFRHPVREVRPAHARPGAGSYTVERVTSASHGIGLVLVVVAVLLAAAVVTGALVLLLRHGAA